MIAAVRNGSYAIAERQLPAHPIPGPSSALWCNATSTGGMGLIWKGSAWADHYQLWSSCDDAGNKWLLLNDTVLENVAVRLVHSLCSCADVAPRKALSSILSATGSRTTAPCAFLNFSL